MVDWKVSSKRLIVTMSCDGKVDQNIEYIKDEEKVGLAITGVKENDFCICKSSKTVLTGCAFSD